MNDAELWRLCNSSKEFVCSVSEVRDPARSAWEDAVVGFELRVDGDGELYLTELHPHRESESVDARGVG